MTYQSSGFHGLGGVSSDGLSSKGEQSASKKEESKVKHISVYSNYVPCLYLPYLKGSNKLILFFHGNAEDLGISYEMLDHLRTALKINVMGIEYPGYGVYEDPEGPSEDKIFEDADLVYNFV